MAFSSANDDATPEDYERWAEQKTTAAIRLAQAATEYAGKDASGFESCMRAAAKYATGARRDHAQAKDLRS